MDAHQHLSGLRVGLRCFFIDERFWTTTDMETNSFHRMTPLTRGAAPRVASLHERSERLLSLPTRELFKCSTMVAQAVTL